MYCRARGNSSMYPRCYSGVRILNNHSVTGHSRIRIMAGIPRGRGGVGYHDNMIN